MSFPESFFRKPIGVYYKALLYMSSLAQWNKKNKLVQCQVCGSNSIKKMDRFPIKTFPILFEKKHLLRKLFYLENLPLSDIKKKKIINIGLEYADGNSYVDYMLCNNCDCLNQNYPHSNEAIEIFYHSYSKYLRRKREGSDQAFKAVHLQFEMISDYVVKNLGGKGKALEIGCAEGQFVASLRGRGWDAHGIDPNERHITIGRAELNLDTINPGFYNVQSYPPGSFDLILSVHVIEHVVDVQQFIKDMFFHLKPGGTILIYTPCSEATQRRFLDGVSPRKIKSLAYAHPVIYSTRYMSNLLEESRFKVAKVEVAAIPEEAFY
ncbi:class I SAM-dependent methyltransferase, partial [Gammaproteobacteria bacterium]|nr:class I SAM-dependent methyltransferase [Gammaproteobacteria bacterium]